jgi:S1-C subfamily serine protease
VRFFACLTGASFAFLVVTTLAPLPIPASTDRASVQCAISASMAETIDSISIGTILSTRILAVRNRVCGLLTRWYCVAPPVPDVEFSGNNREATIHDDRKEQGGSPMKLLATYRHSLLSQVTCIGLFFAAISSSTAQHNTPQTPATVFRQTRLSVALIVGAGGDEVAQGSGFIVAKNRVVTNYHVIEGLSEAYVRFSDGHTEAVQGVVTADKSQDIAVLEVPTSGRPSLPLGDDIALREGDPVLALGAPRGLELTLTNGIVSAFRKSGGQFLIQNTAPIAPGSSGGPLLNSIGQAIGITSMQLTNTPGVYFSIGISQVRTLLKAAATASQPFAQWASGKSVGASPSLAETFAWIKGKVEANAGGRFRNDDPVFENGVHGAREEVSDVRLLQTEDECVFLLERKSRDSIGQGCESTIEDDYSQSLPMYYLKEAAEMSVYRAGIPSVDLKFEEKKVLMHSVRSEVTKGCTDSSKNETSPESANDLRNDFTVIEIYRIPTEDNERLAERLADAFKHAAELCAGRKPKSNEPF